MCLDLPTAKEGKDAKDKVSLKGGPVVEGGSYGGALHGTYVKTDCAG